MNFVFGRLRHICFAKDSCGVTNSGYQLNNNFDKELSTAVYDWFYRIFEWSTSASRAAVFDPLFIASPPFPFSSLCCRSADILTTKLVEALIASVNGSLSSLILPKKKKKKDSIS